ncbi:MAG: DUF1592 domain-containing protein [Halieaceae bacterium]|nr:DUF1592 domain-containing protein [Halieaceae bacterium]
MRKTLQAVIGAGFISLLGCGDTATDAIGGPVAMRRLTAEQYTNVITDTFGPAIDVAGRFEPESRRNGLNALGASLVSVTPSGFEQYEAMARNIAGQVTSPDNRSTILPCQPQSLEAADEACTRQVMEVLGRGLLRRTLTDADLDGRLQAANRVANNQQDFYAGLRLALASLMVAPEFLFRVEVALPAPLPEQPARLALTELSLASRLSYFLWNRGPDEELLSAAERGELSDPAVLSAQVDRMLSSPYLSGGTRAYFEDVFTFDLFDELDKDVTRYPMFSRAVAADAREQTLRFVTEKLIDQRADYRTLFTSRSLPMTRSLGPIYGVPVRSVEGWEDTNLPPGSSRAGLLSHASFAMLYAHPGRSSPTLRGVFMREALLCQTIPEAPADVDFTQFVQDEATVHKTARDRLGVHSTQSSCRKCHVLTDPIGLGLENFDAIGKFRSQENSAPIDSSGDFDGVLFTDAAGLGQAFADSELVGACLVQNLYRYAVGREQTNAERPLLRYLENNFVENGHQLPALMRSIATSEAFRTATGPAASTARRNNNLSTHITADRDRGNAS